MAVKIASATRDAMLDAFETDVGTAPVLKIRTGAPPTNIADADSGTVLSSITLPSDWMAAASGGSKAKGGTWEDASADASGDAGHFRLYKSNGTTQVLQGTVGKTGDSEDMLLGQATVGIVAGQKVTVSTFTLTTGNA